MDVFLLCGQSNMAGRGGVNAAERAWDGAVPDACAVPAGAAWSLRADGAAWEPAAEPLHASVDAPGKTCGVGPGLAFAAALLRQAGRSAPALGLVPCAVGGSALSEWEGPLGARAVARAQAALALPCAAGARSRLAGVLFYQGETDAGDAALAATWGARFEALAAALREALQSPLLPIFVVAITTAPLPAFPHVDAVRQQQLRAPTTVPRCCCVDAAGLPLQADGLHLSAAGAAALGQRLADAWLAQAPAWRAEGAPC
jgi:hypothetical protein